MQLEVLQRKENPLLKRVEVTFKATHKAEPTPTRDALRAFLAKELNATKDIVVIDFQASTYGSDETVGEAKVYKSKEEALAVERKHILVRNKLIEPEVKKEAAPKPEKPAPTPRAEKAEKAAAPAPNAEAPKAEARPASSESSTRLTATGSRANARIARSAVRACSSRDTAIACPAGAVATRN